MAEPPPPEVDDNLIKEIGRFIQGITGIVVKTGAKAIGDPLKAALPTIAKDIKGLIPKDLFDELFGLIKPIDDAAADILAPILEPIFDVMFQKIEVDPNNPEDAMQNLLQSLIRVTVTMGIVAVIPELAHPLKPLGFGRIMPAIVKIGGFETIAGSISSTMIERTAIAPFRYAMNQKLTPYIPGINEIITMTVREVLTPQEMELYLSMHGRDRDWAQRTWEAHWVLPGVSSLYAMFHKGLITEEVLRNMLIRHDFNPSDVIKGAGVTENWPEKLLENAYSALPRVDVRFAFEDDLLTESEVEERMLAAGFSPSDAILERKIQIRRSLASERDDVRRSYQGDFEKGWLSETELQSVLEELGYASAKVNFFIQKSKLRQARTWRDERARIEALMFRNNRTTEAQFRTSLQSLGMEDLFIANLVDLEKLRQKAPKDSDTAPTLTNAQLGGLFRDGKLTEEEYRTELENRGFTATDIERLVQVYEPAAE